jgi:hypothetical protein
MKKSIHLMVLMLIFSIVSNGQIVGGLKGGINFCDVLITKSNDQFEGESFENRTAYHIGTYFQQSLGDQFSWRAEILFSGKGYVHEYEGEKNNIALNYLNLPLLIIYQPIDLLEFELGPEFGYMVAGNEMFSNFDMGVDLGARFNITKKINAGLRYNYGLPFKMKTNNFEEDGYEPSYQNSVFQIYVGFNLIRVPESE